MEVLLYFISFEKQRNYTNLFSRQAFGTSCRRNDFYYGATCVSSMILLVFEHFHITHCLPLQSYPARSSHAKTKIPDPEYCQSYPPSFAVISYMQQP
jgi:hypothetical protein